MYHEVKAPKGVIFPASEVPGLERQGWVDTPAKFGKGLRIKNIVFSFLAKEYKWILGISLTIIGLYLAYLKLQIAR